MSLDETSDIANIKRLIANASTEIESIIQRLNIQLTAENIQRDVVRALVDMQCKLQSRIQELSGTLEHLYEREVQRLLQSQSQCDVLCANDRAELIKEMDTFISFLNIGLETQDLSEVSLFPSFPARFLFLSIIDILMGIPSGSLCGGESNRNMMRVCMGI